MRETIVQAASRCIVERGHAALSTRAVAAEAGVNQSLIHYYFGTKERLTLAVLERMNQTLLKRQAEMFESTGSVADKWAQACRFYESDLQSGYVRLLMGSPRWASRTRPSGRGALRGRRALLASGRRRAGFGIRSVSASMSRHTWSASGTAWRWRWCSA
jgi:AcrR family transcriptional regulator